MSIMSRLGHPRTGGMLTSGGDPAELPQDGFGWTMFTYRGAEGDGFAQHREQKAESISLLPPAPLGANVIGRTEPDSKPRNETEKSQIAARETLSTACAILPSG